MPAVLCIYPTAMTACAHIAKLQLTEGCTPGAACWHAGLRQPSPAMLCLQASMGTGQI